MIGFESAETRRAVRDAACNTDVRTGEYPLIDWDWDRAACEAYIAQHLGVAWAKSACTQCPYSWTSKQSAAAQRERFEASPQEAANAMMLEYAAYALNPTQTLRDTGPLWLSAGPMAIAAFTARLDAAPHALYDVRRVLRPRDDDETRLANAARSVRVTTDPASPGVPVHRWWLRPRPDVFPGVEHLLAVAPAGVAAKQNVRFEEWYMRALAAECARGLVPAA